MITEKQNIFHKLFYTAKIHRRKIFFSFPVVILALATTNVNLNEVKYLAQSIAPNQGEFLQYNNFYDGDKEIAVWGGGRIMRTSNTTDDTNLSLSGITATWQHQSDKGFEIQYWTISDKQPLDLTDNQYEDINPKTDGHYIVWQQKRDGKWNIMLTNLRKRDELPVQISLGGTATDPTIDNGLIAWQEWIDGNWEIVKWEPDEGSIRITKSIAGDINPSIVAGRIYWEGFDPQEKDKEIFSYEQKTKKFANVTANDIEDDSPFIRKGYIYWYRRLNELEAEEVRRDEASGRYLAISLPILPTSPLLDAIGDIVESTGESIGDAISDMLPGDSDEENTENEDTDTNEDQTEDNQDDQENTDDSNTDNNEDADSDTDEDSDTNTNEDENVNEDADADADSDTDADMDSNEDSDTNEDSDENANTNSDTNDNTNTDQNTNTDEDEDSDTDSNANTDTDEDDQQETTFTPIEDLDENNDPIETPEENPQEETPSPEEDPTEETPQEEPQPEEESPQE